MLCLDANPQESMTFKTSLLLIVCGEKINVHNVPFNPKVNVIRLIWRKGK